MPYGARDGRIGRPSPPGAVEMPTHLIPGDCCCSWTVIKPGPGLACKSRLTHENALCRHGWEHERDRQASLNAAAAAEFRPGVA